MFQAQTAFEFAQAVCDQLGLPLDRAYGDVQMVTDIDKILGVRVFFAINAEDMEAIGRRMKELQCPK